MGIISHLFWVPSCRECFGNAHALGFRRVLYGRVRELSWYPFVSVPWSHLLSGKRLTAARIRWQTANGLCEPAAISALAGISNRKRPETGEFHPFRAVDFGYLNGLPFGSHAIGAIHSAAKSSASTGDFLLLKRSYHNLRHSSTSFQHLVGQLVANSVAPDS